jgi:hypothetical protein
MRHTLYTLLVLLLCWPIAAGGDERATTLDAFDHTTHTKAFKRADLGCVNCHPVGVEGALPPAPEASCHACHNTAARPRYGAPDRCDTCHEEVAAPTSHGPAWLQWHGNDADATCNDCHERRDCVDCHESRQQPDLKVHDPGWLGLHGIEAGAGATCDSCHSRTECSDCHGGTL